MQDFSENGKLKWLMAANFLVLACCIFDTSDELRETFQLVAYPTDEFKEQERQLQAARAAPRDQDDMAQHALRMRKLRNRKAEFDLLYYAFNGARIFFRGEGQKVSAPSEDAPGGGESAAAP